MATNYIAAIDLGSSRIAGIIGTRSDTGSFTVIACETENSANCIRRGVIYNVEQAAFHIKGIIKKLENKVPGLRIAKVYVGVGGQSIRSVDHMVVKSLGADGEVTNDIIKEISNECKNFKPDGLEVLSIESPAFYVDGNYEKNPVGVPCSRIEARYKLIVCRPSLRKHIVNSITERVKIEIADIFVSPLALADMVLSDEDKSLGCALVDFGAGVTSLTVFKHKRLVNLWVIPLGSHLITKDITSLNVVEEEAERLKKTYGDATPDREASLPIPMNTTDSMGPRQIQSSELNEVVEARLQEILENVYARLEEAELLGNALGAGIIVTGGGASLKNIENAVFDRFQIDVRPASVRKMFSGRTNGTVEPGFGVAVGLFMKGTVNCAPTPAVAASSKTPVNAVNAEVHVVDGENIAEDRSELQVPSGTTQPVEDNVNVNRPIKPPKQHKRGLIDKWAGFANKLFNDEAYDDNKKEIKEVKAGDKEDDGEKKEKRNDIN